MSSVSEKLLEDEISAHLVAEVAIGSARSGPIQSAGRTSTQSSASTPPSCSPSSRLTQGPEWGKLVKAHGGDEELARQRFVQRLAQQIDERGTVDVLRHGVRDQNVEIRLSYRKPAFGVAPSWSPTTTPTG